MTQGWVDYLTGPYGFAFAFAAGILSFLSPCVLPLVPAYLAHLTGTTATHGASRSERRETVTHAAAFVLGFTLVFTFIGASVGLLGAIVSDDASYAVRDHISLLAKIGGVFLIVMGLNLIGVIKVPFLYRTYTLESATATAPSRAGGGAGASLAMTGGAWTGLGYAKSVVVGAAFAVGWTPCIGPVLGAILTLSATTASVAKGTYLLLVYSLGLGVPFIITGFAVVADHALPAPNPGADAGRGGDDGRAGRLRRHAAVLQRAGDLQPVFQRHPVPRSLQHHLTDGAVREASRYTWAMPRQPKGQSKPPLQSDSDAAYPGAPAGGAHAAADRSTSTSGRSTSSARGRSCAASSRAARCLRSSSGGRRAPARRRWRGSSPRSTDAAFVPVSAVSAGVADLRKAVAEARERLEAGGGRTVLFIDEIHRFNKAQQDAILPFVEDGTITLIGATTENPSFEVIGPLLSRVARLRAASSSNPTRSSASSAAGARRRGARARRRQGVAVDDDAIAALADVAGGDARIALNALEAGGRRRARPRREERPARDARATSTRRCSTGRTCTTAQGDAHYDTISAFIKSLRGSDPDAALYWLARMIEARRGPAVHRAAAW